MKKQKNYFWVQELGGTYWKRSVLRSTLMLCAKKCIKALLVFVMFLRWFFFFFFIRVLFCQRPPFVLCFCEPQNQLSRLVRVAGKAIHAKLIDFDCLPSGHRLRMPRMTFIYNALYIWHQISKCYNGQKRAQQARASFISEAISRVNAHM